LNPDPTGLNNMPNGSFVIKLLLSTVNEKQLPIVKNALEWQIDGFENEDPHWRNKGPISRFRRTLKTARLIQIDFSIRDDRSITGWLLGTFGYDGNAKGETPWGRMVPLGLQWGNNPKVTYAETCSGSNGPCTQEKLTEQWINEQAVKDLATLPLNFDHLGYGGRLAGPVDNAKADCMGCHQTAGFPSVAILPEFSANGSLLSLDANKHPETHQSFRMMYYENIPSGIVFSDTQLYSSDYSLQLSMSLQNFISLRCRPSQDTSAHTPSICDQFDEWSRVQKKAITDLRTFGTAGADGAPIGKENEQ
jgi:hypothetical protein